MEIHQWMINYTRQTEWIDRRGLILWIAFYTGGLGGGLYIVSLFFNSIWGMFIGWLIIAVLKGGAHLLYLGKPEFMAGTWVHLRDAVRYFRGNTTDDILLGARNSCRSCL